MKVFSRALDSKYASMEIQGVGLHTGLLGALTHKYTHASRSSEKLGHTTCMQGYLLLPACTSRTPPPQLVPWAPVDVPCGVKES